MSGNAVIESLKTRRAVRSYADRPVEREKLEAILEAATYAPTGMGAQSPVIVLVESKEIRDKVAALNAGAMGRDTDPFYGAPAVAIVFGHKDVVPTWFEDACLVAGNLLNAAHAVGVFETDEGRALLKEWGLDGDYVGVANCILGYGDGPASEPKPRKDGYVRIV